MLLLFRKEDVVLWLVREMITRGPYSNFNQVAEQYNLGQSTHCTHLQLLDFLLLAQQMSWILVSSDITADAGSYHTQIYPISSLS